VSVEDVDLIDFTGPIVEVPVTEENSALCNDKACK
jgi:hypothetical protein